MLFRRDTIANQLDPRLDFGESMKRSGERGGAKQMVRVVVRDVEARERLPERADGVDDLTRLAQRILRIDRDDLRRQLDKMRVDPPPLLGRGVSMDANAAAAVCCSDLAEHAHSLKLGGVY
jgi:hypothetical protein